MPGGLNQVSIRVLESNRFGNAQPVSTIECYSNDFSIDYFICPDCKSKVNISHWKDERGVWPNVDLPCSNCGRHWSISK